MTRSVADGDAYRVLCDELGTRGINVENVESRLAAQSVETPSWAYSAFGTRFFTFTQPGQARRIEERLQDAAEVHRLVGICPSVAIHIPWDEVDDYGGLRHMAADMGLRIGTVNPNLFQGQAYRLGSVSHPDDTVRRAAIDHVLACIDIAEQIGAPNISLWFADGTNYPGQDSLPDRRSRLQASLEHIYAALAGEMRLLLEYKFFEPSFYATDIPDWGTALLLCQRLGQRAKVLVDLGHHAQGVNIEQIVATLADEDRLGGFHYNNRKYADDDLIVGSINPFELFLISSELVAAERRVPPAMADVVYTLDQCHNVEPNIEAVVWSVLNVQHAYARALIVDYEALRNAQLDGDVMLAHRLLVDAFETDVRPLCAVVRERLGASPDPIADLRQGAYLSRIASERGPGLR